jgi:hypothetical protein
VLTNWTLKRRGVDVPINSFKFEKHFVLHPNRQIKVKTFLLFHSTIPPFFNINSILNRFMHVVKAQIIYHMK